jgi:tRNA (cmo5U34)-methyltransferase
MKTMNQQVKKSPQATTESSRPLLVKSGDADKLFAEAEDMRLDFKFDGKTAAVFDDMVTRSVPFYDEIQRMTCELSADFTQPGTNLYDLGCATGTTFMMLDDKVDPSVRFVGIDNSSDMLGKAEKKMARLASGRNFDLVEADLHSQFLMANASVVLLVLTLQFVRPLYRDKLVQRIADAMPENGALILVEKLTSSHTMLNRLFIKYYYDYKKRNGYSEVEIAQKREALENVLIPYRPEENALMLKEAGFRHCEEFFRWYNFCGMVAVK